MTFDYDPPTSTSLDEEAKARGGGRSDRGVSSGNCVSRTQRRAAEGLARGRTPRRSRGAAASFDADLDRVATTALPRCSTACPRFWWRPPRPRAPRLGVRGLLPGRQDGGEREGAGDASIGVEEIDAIRDPGAPVKALVPDVFAEDVFDLGAAASAARRRTARRRPDDTRRLATTAVVRRPPGLGSETLGSRPRRRRRPRTSSQTSSRSRLALESACCSSITQARTSCWGCSRCAESSCAAARRWCWRRTSARA